jgi:hypothetical protein
VEKRNAYIYRHSVSSDDPEAFGCSIFGALRKRSWHTTSARSGRIGRMMRKGLGGWSEYHRSPEFRRKADAALAQYNARRPFLLKCGARRKRDGEPCQNLALGNGRCRCHGGRTPSGDGWHRPVWPNGEAPDAEIRLYRKLQNLERAARSRAARLQRMSDGQRKQHEEWHKARPATSAAERAEIKRMKQSAKMARKLFANGASGAAVADPEYLALVDRIAELRAELVALHDNHTKAAGTKKAEQITEGVFG